MAQLRGVLLDVDGTLIDSNNAHAHAWVAALGEVDIAADFDQILGMIGEGGDKIMPQVAHVEKDSPQGKQISARRMQIFKERFLPNLAAFTGAHELLLRMRDNGLKLVVATSASEEELGDLLNLVGGETMIDAYTTSSEAPKSKPDPDIIEAAISKSGFPPDALVMLGDTPYDIQAAAKAGVATIALRCGGWSDTSLKGAKAIYTDPAELLAHYADSPLAQ